MHDLTFQRDFVSVIHRKIKNYMIKKSLEMISSEVIINKLCMFCLLCDKFMISIKLNYRPNTVTILFQSHK